MLEVFERNLIAQLNLGAWQIGDSENRKAIMGKLFDFAKAAFDLKPQLYFTMPEGFEQAYGLSNPVTGDIHVNEVIWDQCDPIDPLFYFLHELRHSIQSSNPQLFSEAHQLNCIYLIQFDGTGYKVDGGDIRAVRLEGEQGYFTELYLASPCEQDANAFAYRCLKAAGATERLDELYAMWSPRYVYFTKEEALAEFYKTVSEIDRRIVAV